MLILRKTLALAAILISFCAPKPYILVQNFSKQNICYKVEYSSGTGAFPNTKECGEAKGPNVGGFLLKSGLTKGFDATGTDGQPFNGAISAVINNNTDEGARNEINLLNSTMAWYDISYQYGFSDGTCGPANTSSANLSGERDTLGKANAAWKTLDQTKKNNLLQKYPNYLKQNANGSLTHIDMTSTAQDTAPDLVYFFQVTAGFKGYISFGSVQGVTWPAGSMQSLSVRLADKQALSAPTDQIVITSY